MLLSISNQFVRPRTNWLWRRHYEEGGRREFRLRSFRVKYFFDFLRLTLRYTTYDCLSRRIDLVVLLPRDNMSYFEQLLRGRFKEIFRGQIVSLSIHIP